MPIVELMCFLKELIFTVKIDVIISALLQKSRIMKTISFQSYHLNSTKEAFVEMIYSFNSTKQAIF